MASQQSPFKNLTRRSEMKKKVYARYGPPLTEAKIIEQVGIIASSPSTLIDYIQILAKEHQPHSSPIDKALKEEALRVSNLTGEEQILAAFKLGQLHTLKGLIDEESEKYRKQGSQNKKKKWAYDLAKQLVKSHPRETRERLWNKIPTRAESERSTDIPSIEVYRDGEILCAVDKNGKEQTLKKSTFFTDYLSEARQNA